MAEYEAWNRAIAGYFVAGVAKGAPVYLSLDEDALDDIADRFLDEPTAESPQEDFLAAVRDRCITFNATVSLRPFRLPAEDELPHGVGFIGLMVFAAYQMHEEEGIDETNYFLRLRELLGLPVQQGRPDGMNAGAEEPLWLAWNEYLQAGGYEPTAERGSGPQTYLRYPISQAILRESDKDHLRTLYDREHLPLTFDCGQLGFWLTRQNITRRHLREGLFHPDQNRVWEFFQAAHRVYEAGDWGEVAPGTRRTGSRRRRTIECGLYRDETLLGDAEYYAFPKQPARTRTQDLRVANPQDGTQVPLEPLRAGYFRPAWAQRPFVDEAIDCPVIGDTHLQMLLIPRRDFWVLTVDPENPEGAWATWRPYLELGEQLLVLCRLGQFDEEMTRFREAKLIEWEDRIEAGGWAEYHGCMVLSYDWGGFISTPDCRALADALSPRAMAGISLSGGLRDPNQNGWLEGFPPTIRVYGFERRFDLTITAADGYRVLHEEVSAQEDILLPDDLEPGAHQVERTWSGKRVAMRVFRIVSWRSIQPRPAPERIINRTILATGGVPMCGAHLLPDDEVGEVERA